MLTGRIGIRGTGSEPGGAGVLTIDGLWLAGNVRVLVGNLARLHLVDATLVPGRANLKVRAGAGGRNDALVLELTRTVAGPLRLEETTRELRLDTAIVDGNGQAIDATQTDVTIGDSTILGEVAARSLAADSTIFTGAVRVQRRQRGCLRYCVLPTEPPTVTPRRYRCQPDLALAAASDPDTGRVDPQTEMIIRARIRPVFTARRHGHPAYCQLGHRCAPEITGVAADGAEMGVYRPLYQPVRRSNLTTASAEYLRIGLNTGALFVT